MKKIDYKTTNFLAAVYAARALYATVNDALGFDDGYLCMNEDWYFPEK